MPDDPQSADTPHSIGKSSIDRYAGDGLANRVRHLKTTGNERSFSVVDSDDVPGVLSDTGFRPSMPLVPWFTRRRVATGISVLVVLITACMAGAILASAIQRATENLVAHSLQSVLAANVHSLEMMFSDLQGESERYSRDERVRQLSLQLLRGDDELTPYEGESIRHELRVIIPELIGTVPWLVMSRDGVVLASSRESIIGLKVEFSKLNHERLIGGKSTLAMPQRLGETESQTVVMVSMSPLMDRNQCFGAFGWVMEADDRFSDLLKITQSGETDESYAIDGRGRMLSTSRFEVQLAEKGFPEYSVLNYQMRDPGADVLASDQLTIPMQQLPLTRMADQATRRADGMELEGYRNYRGAMVVGAWKWLPEFDMAVATEIDVAEAYQPATILRRVLIATLAGVVTLSGIALSLIAYSRHRAIRKPPMAAEEEGDGRRIGQYRILELLGVGGMGSVYRGQHEYLRRDVAIKVLEGERLSTRSVARFHREVQLTSTLRHPNTIAIYDFGQCSAETGESQIGSSRIGEEVDPAETFYYVMEYIDGISLQQLIDYYGPQTPERTVHFLLQICGSISEAHNAGLIHRDIKPANILVSAHGGLWDHIKVLDFGLVKDIGGDSNLTLQEGVTRADSMTGTPLYMAPETIRDPAAASPRADIYSIGSVGYALLTGRPIFEGDSVIDLCLKQLEQNPPRPEDRLQRRLPTALQDILMRCLDRSASKRFQTVAECTAALESLPEAGRWTQARSVEWWANEFEQAARTQPGQTKNPTVDDTALTR
ncbi:serine/threonine protein kinase [Rhodopirellula europaea]|uniref:Serine/threonine-protein kinase n=1 Tax=Rhodopirellula europaea 6C TaxID=1263867 RepID=M2A4J5_9BACT|nr:serine/threonine protein kinase [Rhodopirellula europaea]EMB14606.1 serine/threonine-protein kinase [Rhodopirellula europaea 6C]